MPKFEEFHGLVGDYTGRGPICREGIGTATPGVIEIIRHSGYESYVAKCYKLAPTHDCAVMAAAVVNWIPKNPIEGKMPTKGYKERDEISIPFYLAPRVINRMKGLNPKLTLIGCKMTSGSSFDELIYAAYRVVLDAHCNVVVANDMQAGLKGKHLVYQDRTVQSFHNDFDGFFAALEAVIEDEHFSTTTTGLPEMSVQFHPATRQVFDRIVEKYRGRFTPVEGDRVYGSVAVRCQIPASGWMCSPREKGQMFTSDDAVVVADVDWEKNIVITHDRKATLNAPLLIRYGTLSGHDAVIHLHEQIEGLPTLPYAPPGTVRDNGRELAPMVLTHGFNIEGHGCILPA